MKVSRLWDIQTVFCIMRYAQYLLKELKCVSRWVIYLLTYIMERQTFYNNKIRAFDYWPVRPRWARFLHKFKQVKRLLFVYVFSCSCVGRFDMQHTRIHGCYHNLASFYISIYHTSCNERTSWYPRGEGWRKNHCIYLTCKCFFAQQISKT